MSQLARNFWLEIPNLDRESNKVVIQVKLDAESRCALRILRFGLVQFGLAQNRSARVANPAWARPTRRVELLPGKLMSGQRKRNAGGGRHEHVTDRFPNHVFRHAAQQRMGEP